MGIVLKRRDNAPIVKYVFGNVIEKIMIDKDFDLALNWLKENLIQIKNGEFNLENTILIKKNQIKNVFHIFTRDNNIIPFA